MNHHCDKIIYRVEQIVKSKWCLFVVKEEVIPINLSYSVIIPRKKVYNRRRGVKKICGKADPRVSPRPEVKEKNLTK